MTISSAYLKGFIPYQENTGFALPVFVENQGKDVICIAQPCLKSNNIASFVRAKNWNLNKITAIRSNQRVFVGDPLRFVFIQQQQVAYGNINEIEPALRSYVIKYPQDLNVCLQIAELIGSQQEKILARVRVENQILHDLGSEAASHFIYTVAYNTAWTEIFQASLDEAAAQHLIAAKNQIDVYVSPENDFNISINDACQPYFGDYSISLLKKRIDELLLSLSKSNKKIFPELNDVSAEINRVVSRLMHRHVTEERLVGVLIEYLGNKKITRELRRDQFPRSTDLFKHALDKMINELSRDEEVSEHDISNAIKAVLLTSMDINNFKFYLDRDQHLLGDIYRIAIKELDIFTSKLAAGRNRVKY